MEETDDGCDSGSNTLTGKFMRKTPAWLLDRHRHHMRDVGCVIQKYTAKALLAAVAYSHERKSWSEDSLFMTGCVREGASMARLFSSDQYTSKEFEVDMMLTFFEFRADESLIHYVEKNQVFAHVEVDSSILTQIGIRSDFDDDVPDETAMSRHEDCVYLNSKHFQNRFDAEWPSFSIFDNNPFYRFFVTDGDCVSGSASISSWVDGLVDAEDDDGCANSSARLFQLALQLKPYCDRFETTLEEMLARLSVLQQELANSTCLHNKATKALEWAKTCMKITDLIFDCRQATLCTFVNRSIGIDLHTINDRPRERIKGQLEEYIGSLTVTENDLSDSIVAASVCRILDDIENVTSQEFPRTFHQLASDVTMFSRLISFGRQNPQLCQTPTSLEQLSAIIKRYSIDYVPCIKLMFWPSVAAEWKTRDRLWPNQSVIEEIVSKGTHLVGKAFCHEEMDWRLSFSVAEIDLVTRWSAAQHFVYFVFKSLFYKFIKPLSVGFTSEDSSAADGKKYLPSYLAKTVMMWTSESFDQSWWSEDNADECLTVLLLALQSAFETRTLHHYFVCSVNLLEGHPNDLARRVVDTVDYILSQPTAVNDQLASHFEKTETVLKAMPEEAKSVRDISVFLNVMSSLFTALTN